MEEVTAERFHTPESLSLQEDLFLGMTFQVKRFGFTYPKMHLSEGCNYAGTLDRII